MKKSQIVMFVMLLVVIPATLLLGMKLPGRSYYLLSAIVAIEILIPFFMAFEGRKPQPRELVTVAVMAALVTIARVAVPLPSFKPTYAVIMLTGIAFGPETGFIVGALGALGSDFFYGQGPFTPWQMMAYDMAALWLCVPAQLAPAEKLGDGGVLLCLRRDADWSAAGHQHSGDHRHYVHLGEHAADLCLRSAGQPDTGCLQLSHNAVFRQRHPGKA